MKKVVLFGATSAIAHEAARCFARRGAELLLVARNGEKLSVLQKDLETLGAAKVQTHVCDLVDIKDHESLLKTCGELLPEYDAILLAYGTLGDQGESEKDFSVAEQEFRTNFLSAASLVSRVANMFEARGSGQIAVITSVAGDRGRKSNYIYGTAKGALSIFLQGLRNRLSSTGVHVLTIKPGFVDTPMTAHIEKGPLFASAQAVGEGIYRAMERKKDVVYLPWFWRFIMLIIKAIPEPLFKRMSI